MFFISKIIMKKDKFTESKAENNPTGGVLVGKRQGQTIIHNKGTLSGYLVGKTHAEGGIKAINKSTGQPLEMQGGEVVITAPAVSDQTKHDFDGEMLTNRQILSKINERGGGVAFAQDGMEIPKDIKRTGASYNFGGKTMTDHEIYKYITGGHLAKGYSLKDIANMHKISIADLKKEVRMGLKAESEHTSSKREQMQIVKDHLYENPKYYTLLKKAGLKKGAILEEGENDHVKYYIDKYLKLDIAENNLKKYLSEELGYSKYEIGLLPEKIRLDSKYMELKSIFDKEFSKSKLKLNYKYPKTRDRVQEQKDLRRYKEILNEVIKNKFENGGNLIEESEKGEHTSRDLNNYNDLLDVGADGQVGMDNGLAFANGGEVDCYADGGATLSAEVFEWNKVPTNYRNISKVKKVPFINNPLDKGLDSIIAPFLGKDDLRPVMSGINFDENGITGTNAHILITLPYPNKKYEGVYDVNKAKKTKSDELLLINENYPKYKNIIPKSEDAGTPYQVDVYKLLQYTKTAMNYSNKTTYAIAFKYGEDERIGFNGKFLSIVLTTALKLGHEKIYVFIQSKSRAFILSPNKNYELGNDELLLTMPVMLEANYVYYIDKYGTNDPDYNRSLKAYFDFNDNQIHNADGSVAEFKMKYENNLSVDDDYLALLTKITRKQYTLPILSYAKVENGKMTATDLETSLIVKNVDMPDGIYEIVNKAPNITMNPIEDFPRERIFEKDEYITKRGSDRIETSFEFVTFSEVFEFYLDKLLLSVGNDDLRPVMSGICIKKTRENQMFLVSTNAHTLCKINITEYCEFNKDDRELEYILPVTYLKDFVKLADGSLHFKCSISNIFIEAENLEFIARATDGKYPNYEAVIPKENNKKIVFDHSIMNKCLKSEKYTSLVAKYKDNKKVNYHIFNSGDKLFIKAYELVGNQIQTIEDVEFCSVDIDYSETYNRITENDSLFLLMPVMTASTTPDRYFAFSKYYFDVMLKTITDTEVECYFTEPNRAYIFPIDAIDYKKTLPVEKKKQQKLSKADVKMIEEMETIQSESNELQDAIETLIMLLETAKGKAKREIKEALEILQMLNEK